MSDLLDNLGAWALDPKPGGPHTYLQGPPPVVDRLLRQVLGSRYNPMVESFAVFGMPVLANKFIPRNELWATDANGYLIQKFVLPGEHMSTRFLVYKQLKVKNWNPLDGRGTAEGNFQDSSLQRQQAAVKDDVEMYEDFNLAYEDFGIVLDSLEDADTFVVIERVAEGPGNGMRFRSVPGGALYQDYGSRWVGGERVGEILGADSRGKWEAHVAGQLDSDAAVEDES